MVRYTGAVVLALCMTVGPVVDAWLNNFDQPFHFECEHGQCLSHINSEHNNHYEDRVWSFGCRALRVTVTAENCEWTNYENQYDQPLVFSCPGEGFITGMSSVHDNHHEDRRFAFQCCQIPGIITRSCSFTGWENTYDGMLDYRLPTNYILRGVASAHDNGHEDRIFKFEICQLENH